ncbi:MAG TPA: redoxin domain-containing protein [Balneolaceae bacterium]|nr:redoxin domain-containing protein [Balneolaceae bacterium]
MRNLKSRCLILLCGILVACSNPQKTQKQAREILQSVEQQYKSMKTFELQATLNSTVKSVGKNQNSSFAIYYARKEPAELHIEMRGNQLGMTVVSNGNTTWTYIPSAGEYKVERSSLVQSAQSANGQISQSDFTDMGEQLTETYKAITTNLKEAEVLGTKTVTMADGSKRKAYKIKATYNQNSGMQDMKVSPTTYLIDKKTYLVLQQSLQVSAKEDSPRSPLTMYQTVNLKEANLHPSFADSVFAFNPPSSAKKVDQFAFESGQNGTGYDLVGKKAKNFDLTSFSGKKINLKDLRGKVVVLDFWATWCGPCREAHPHLQKLYSEYKDDGLVVLGINSESKQKVQHYMNENGYTFTNLMDPDQSVGMDYRVDAIPSVFVINRKGIVNSHLVGYQPESALRKAIKKAGL